MTPEFRKSVEKLIDQYHLYQEASRRAAEQIDWDWVRPWQRQQRTNYLVQAKENMHKAHMLEKLLTEIDELTDIINSTQEYR